MASVAGSLYTRIYDALCGRHPKQLPWHFQWLAVRELRRQVRAEVLKADGSVLDVGCGEKPYRMWAKDTAKWIGLDIAPGPEVDVVVRPLDPWPFPDHHFDFILCTQVLEHSADTSHVLSQLQRTLRPHGAAAISIPFIYNEHGAPHDYWRFSKFGVERLLSRYFEDVQVMTQGGAGSAAGQLLLNWLEAQMNQRKWSRLLKAAFLWLWLIVCLAVNLLGMMVDKVDTTNGFYGNSLAVVRRPKVRPS